MLGTEGVCTGRLQQRLQMWYGVHMVPRQLFVSPPAIYSRIAASASAATHPCWCGVGDASQNRSPQRHPSVWHLHVRLHTTCWGAPALSLSSESISPPAIYSRIAASASAATHPCWCGVGDASVTEPFAAEASKCMASACKAANDLLGCSSVVFELGINIPTCHLL